MKFDWRLQRILDIRKKQEEAQRAKLMQITEKQLGLKSQIMLIKANHRMAIANVKSLSPKDRIQFQSMLIDSSMHDKQQISQINLHIDKLQTELEEQRKIVAQTRKNRKGLEKLREKAQQEYVLEQNVIEQKQLDELTSTAITRQMAITA